MAYDKDGSLAPFNFGRVIEMIPELKSLELKLTVISFPEPKDSANIRHEDWDNLAYIIYENYAQYDAFVILHGTDTMSYTASALSYMLRGLNKPVIFTGAQIPIGYIRSDARDNILTALEIATAKEDGEPIVNEVCVYFNLLLMRGNRTSKIRSSDFAAFQSPNFPVLAESGISIEYNRNYMKAHDPKAKLSIVRGFNDNVIILKVFPSMSQGLIRSILSARSLQGVVLETFGSGNTMNYEWFLKEIEKAISRDIIIFNVSQCVGGEVLQGRYETSKRLKELGVLGGNDITTEAAITKLMFLLGTEKSRTSVRKKLAKSLNGEMDD